MFCKPKPGGLADIGSICRVEAIAVDDRPDQAREVVDEGSPCWLVTLRRGPYQLGYLVLAFCVVQCSQPRTHPLFLRCCRLDVQPSVVIRGRTGSLGYRETGVWTEREPLGAFRETILA